MSRHEAEFELPDLQRGALIVERQHEDRVAALSLACAGMSR